MFLNVFINKNLVIPCLLYFPTVIEWWQYSVSVSYFEGFLLNTTEWFILGSAREDTPDEIAQQDRGSFVWIASSSKEYVRSANVGVAADYGSKGERRGAKG